MARLKQTSESTLDREAAEYRSSLFAEPGIELLRVPFQNPYIQLLWRQHYVGSKGTVGRQLHYIIYFDGLAVGGISAGSAMFAHKKRDRFLSIVEQERREGLRHIVNNTMFRLTRPRDAEPKATEVLRLFRSTVIEDWKQDYGDSVRAFETLVEPPRWGGIYKLDGWRRIGNTAGLGARRPEGHGTAGKASTGVRQIIRVPEKIVWVLPICSYEDALASSDRRNSYGDDGKAIVEFLSAKPRSWYSPETIAARSGVSFDRVRTLLYLLQNADKKVSRSDTGLYRIASNEADEV